MNHTIDSLRRGFARSFTTTPRVVSGRQAYEAGRRNARITTRESAREGARRGAREGAREGARQGTRQAVRPTERVVTGTVVINRDAAKQAARSAVRNSGTVAIGLAKNVGLNLGILEVFDWVENWWGRRKRHQKIARINRRMIRNGRPGQPDFDEVKHAENLHKLEKLNRRPRRRSVRQWFKDLPARTMRRLYRAVLVEAGWWTMLLTMPVWLVTVAAWFIANLGVAAFSFLMEVIFKSNKNVDRVLDVINGAFGKVLKYTLLMGLRIFSKGAAMRIYNEDAYTNERTFPLLDEAKTAVFAKLPKLNGAIGKDNAYDFGAQLAEEVLAQVGAGSHTVEATQAALIQAHYWAKNAIFEEYRRPVLHGFRERSPLMYRDLVKV